jgi:RND superfamily putative drug exporter
MRTRISGNGAPPPPAQNRNLAARMGRWSAQHRKKAIFGWLAFVLVALFIGMNGAPTETLVDQESGVGESGRADETVYDAFPKKADEEVLVQSQTLTTDDPEFRAVVSDVQGRLGEVDNVKNVIGPYGNANGVSPDNHSVLIDYEVPGDADETSDRIDAPIAAIDQAAKAHPDFFIDAFGDASIEKEFEEEVLNKDFQKAEVTSLPITLIILAIAFGTLVAAGIPLLLALTAVAATLGLIGPISQIAPVSESINSVVLLIGLAVGVDYCLFYIRREREERAAGRGPEAALEAAAATSGRAVLISGFTVMFAMGGMYLGNDPDFTSFATGTIVVVGVAMIGSLTVLPAVLSKLGDRIERGRVPLLGRIKARTAKLSIWPRIVDRVLRRPVLSLVLAGGFLIALAIPALGLHTAEGGTDTLPQDLAVVQTYNRVLDAFPSENSGAQVVVVAEDVSAAPITAAVRRLGTETAKDTEVFKGELETDVSPDLTVLTVDVPTVGDGIEDSSVRAMEELRDNLVPAAFGTLDGVSADVTGSAAETVDFNDNMNSRLPYVFGFVLGAAFLLLLVTFRSIVIPIKAILLNLLSVGAAYGVLVLVFQNEWAEGLLNFTSSDAITPWLPLFLFVVLFGLSMDYHVFILTRVREAYDRGMTTEEAVSSAIKKTAGVVTSAAVVMVAVFAIFATLTLLDFKQMGVGLAVAVLLDATIIRGVLLPASMKLLGDWNWYLPKWLEWLPRVSPEPDVGDAIKLPAPEPEPEPEPAPV